MVQSNQAFEIPLILGESYDLYEETEVRRLGTEFGGGLLANGEVIPAAFLSMSGYNNKSHPDEIDDFETTSKPFQDPTYEFPQPHVEVQYDLGAVAQGRPVDNQTAFLRPQPYQQPPNFEASHEQFEPLPRQPQFPTVHSYAPRQGRRGSRVTIQVRSLENLEDSSYTFSIVFGQKRQLSEMTKVKVVSQYQFYTLSTEAPAFQTTLQATSPVKLSLQTINTEGQVLRNDHFGDFYYLDTSSSGDETNRKRKQSLDTLSDLSVGLRNKRAASTTHNRPKDDESPTMLPNYSSRRSITYSPFLQPQPNRAQVEMSPRQPPSTYSYSPTGGIPATQGSSSPNVSGWNPNYRMSQNPGLGINAPKIRTAPAVSSDASAPAFIRSTHLGTSPSPALTHSGMVQPGQAFNPYFPPPLKAQLKIDGELDTMTEASWNHEEWEAKRRIVRFRRNQTGGTITTTFEPIAIDERPPNSICISCIWWEEKKECFVTSVDTIYLLESLVAVRFTVEEKNRIRRNLEGFRPLTVSKAKADSEEFFKIIMGFPNPKPRNIEKDVKVFPWKILAHALKKIIGKYSASYSSTAGTLHPVGPLQPAPPSGYSISTAPSHTMDAMVHQRPTPSPRSTSASTTSVTRTPSLTSLAYSPGPSHGMQYAATTPDLRGVQPSPLSGQYGGAMGPVWAPQQAYSDQATAVYPVTSQGPRASWDYSPYLEAAPPVSSAAAGQQGIYYSPVTFTPNTTDEMAASIQRRMSHHTTGP
ncbi:MAG: hypothetical protein M1814_004801 [Vezdaea aestivalis]|nr:MAG: hypothetical protein M1814_004801 [Vezdaea aestivalis]